VFAQVVIAMGHHGYMELEGGTQMIEFIVTQCSLPDEPPVGLLRSFCLVRVFFPRINLLCDVIMLYLQ